MVNRFQKELSKLESLLNHLNSKNNKRKSNKREEEASGGS